MIKNFDENTVNELIKGTNPTIEFDPSVSKDDLISTLRCVYDYENTFDFHDSNNGPRIFINLKNLPSQLKAEALKYSMTREDLTNASMIINIVNLTNGISNLNDEFFANKEVYFTSLIDIVTVKSLILNEVKQFCTNMATWLLSSIKSANITEYSVLDEPKKLPRLVECIFLSYDLITLTNYINNGNSVSTDDLYIVENAYYYVIQMCNKNAIAKSLFDGFMENFGASLTDNEN